MTISDKLSLLEQTKEAQRVKLGLPESIPFSQYVNFIRYPFAPSELFKNGEQGVWFDPSDLSTMFQDVNGNNPVTKDGDPVGLILDKSQGIYSQDMMKTGELTFTPYGENTVNYLQEVYEINHVDHISGAYIMFNPVNILGNLEESKLYEVTFEVKTTSPSIRPLLQLGIGNHTSTYVEKSEQFTEVALRLRAKGTSVIQYYLRVPTEEGERTYIRNISIKEIKGNHATQETASSRPVYRTDGKLHWLEFDGVDDCLYSNQYPRKTPQNVVISASRSNSNQIYLTGTATNNSLLTLIVATNNHLTMLRTVGGVSDPAIFNRAPTANIVHALWNNEKSYVFLNGNTYDRETEPVSPTLVKGIGIGVASASWFANKLAGNVYQVVSFEGITNTEDSLEIRRYVSNKAGITL